MVRFFLLHEDVDVVAESTNIENEDDDGNGNGSAEREAYAVLGRLLLHIDVRHSKQAKEQILGNPQYSTMMITPLSSDPSPATSLTPVLERGEGDIDQTEKGTIELMGSDEMTKGDATGSIPSAPMMGGDDKGEKQSTAGWGDVDKKASAPLEGIVAPTVKPPSQVKVRVHNDYTTVVTAQQQRELMGPLSAAFYCITGTLFLLPSNSRVINIKTVGY